jgi:RNA polymerase sigma factor (sigma-70 family)
MPRARRAAHRGRLPPDLEHAVVVAAQRGGQRERQQLIDVFVPSIASIARLYRRSSTIDWTELMQEGVVGLLRALERYDSELGVPFWAYASWWVRQAMQQLVSELCRPLVLSDRALRQLARIKDAQRLLEQTRGREPTCHDVAAVVGLPRPQVESLIRTERTSRGLDEPIGSDAREGTTVGELLADPSSEQPFEDATYRVLAAQLPWLLAQLTERERTVICSRFGIGQQQQTLREVAWVLGVSAERVRQIEQDSLAKLHSAASSEQVEARGA